MAKKKIVKRKKLPIKKKSKNLDAIKKISLFVFSILLPVLFFNLPLNKQWMNARPVKYFGDMQKQIQNMDIEKRKSERHGITYAIAKHLCDNIPEDSWVLMPPQAYYLNQIYDYKKLEEVRETYQFISRPKIFNFHCPQLNVVTMEMNDEVIKKAEYTISMSSANRIQIIKIDNESTLEYHKNIFDYDYNTTSSITRVKEIITELQSN